MKSVAFVAAAALALSPLSLAFAQNQLPATNVTAPKPKPTPPVVNHQVSRAPVDNSGQILPEHPDPETPRVRARDWNAPGVMNLNYMTEAQFVAFQAAHPRPCFMVAVLPDRTRIQTSGRSFAGACRSDAAADAIIPGWQSREQRIWRLKFRAKLGTKRGR